MRGHRIGAERSNALPPVGVNIALSVQNENSQGSEPAARRRLAGLALAAAVHAGNTINDRVPDRQSASTPIPQLRIGVRRSNAVGDLRTLQLFYEIGKEWEAGAPSLRVIARTFVERDLCGQHKNGCH